MAFGQEQPCRSEEERQLKAVQENIEECRRKAESVQLEWRQAEQQLIAVAMVRDQQSIQLERLSIGTLYARFQHLFDIT